MAASVELLKAARAKIADPANWTTRAFARDGTGYVVAAGDSSAVCWCAVGALIASGGLTGDAEHFLLKEMAYQYFEACGVASLNDSRGHNAVLRLYDLAIAQAEASNA